jgi:HD-GYP domain-containing protein (c-di-GMP phosphodiesterase class II)
MTSDRPYRKARSKEEAVAELKRCAGKNFDPEVVAVFLQILEEQSTAVLNAQPEKVT